MKTKKKKYMRMKKPHNFCCKCFLFPVLFETKRIQSNRIENILFLCSQSSSRLAAISNTTNHYYYHICYKNIYFLFYIYQPTDQPTNKHFSNKQTKHHHILKFLNKQYSIACTENHLKHQPSKSIFLPS